MQHNICVNIRDFSANNIHFASPMSNLVLKKGLFVKLGYITKNIIITELYLTFAYSSIRPNTFANLEYEILSAYLKSVKQVKTIEFRISNHPAPGIHTHGCLKLSGIWETDTACGLIYKFIHDVQPSVV